MEPYTPDLFAPSTSVLVHDELDRAFQYWRDAGVASDRLLRESTVQVYEDMWKTFADWCIAQDPAVTTESLTRRDLELFLQSRKRVNDGALSARYAWRLVTLVDHVLSRWAVANGTERNTAAAEFIESSSDIRHANASDPPHPEYLDADQARRLVLFLSEVRPGATGRRQIYGWQELRNITAVALHLGAGVTPGDLRDLRLDAPITVGGRWKDVPFKLRVPGNGNRAGRETPIAPWAGHLLKYWLEVRAGAGIREPASDDKGDRRPAFLFPGRSGQQWGKLAHYEAVQNVLKAAGVDDVGNGVGGAFRLRHTFALRQIRRQKSLSDVARWMGITNVSQLEQYRAILGHYEGAV